eukprot:CAMPEP_0119352674 /NCGR_PEP_ID=MMETSP1334-20130426/1948_1 /TAXON_ID=127549 /ORGANISM="Calcidiscus leptoporus, Strain RCC1130" /LENGTH=386 /DNA_ID=CAMNT_0007365777 /DNA_START=26 /DNA_END=1187 /DNA_ORIENTATION=+
MTIKKQLSVPLKAVFKASSRSSSTASLTSLAEKRRDLQAEELMVHADVVRHARKTTHGEDGQDASQPARVLGAALREEAERPVALGRNSSFSSATSSPATSPAPLRRMPPSPPTSPTPLPLHQMPRTRSDLGASTPGGATPRRGPGTHPALKPPMRAKAAPAPRNDSSTAVEGLPIQHSGVSGILNEMGFASSEAQAEQLRDRQAEELMRHVSRHTRKRPLSCEEKKKREVVMLNRERMRLTGDAEPIAMKRQKSTDPLSWKCPEEVASEVANRKCTDPLFFEVSRKWLGKWLGSVRTPCPRKCPGNEVAREVAKKCTSDVEPRDECPATTHRARRHDGAMLLRTVFSTHREPAKTRANPKTNDGPHPTQMLPAHDGMNERLACVP